MSTLDGKLGIYTSPSPLLTIKPITLLSELIICVTNL